MFTHQCVKTAYSVSIIMQYGMCLLMSMFNIIAGIVKYDDVNCNSPEITMTLPSWLLVVSLLYIIYMMIVLYRFCKGLDAVNKIIYNKCLWWVIFGTIGLIELRVTQCEDEIILLLTYTTLILYSLSAIAELFTIVVTIND